MVVQAPERLRGHVGSIRATSWPAWRAVRELGFVGAHSYPHWFGLPPDHRA